jgi:hypothetical protein
MKLPGLITVCFATFSLSLSINTQAATTVLIDNFSIDKKRQHNFQRWF